MSFLYLSVLFFLVQKSAISFVASSSAFGTIVSVDPIAVSDDEFKALDELLANELIGIAVNIQSMDLSHYRP